MLYALAEGSELFIIGIDPGTNTCGFCVMAIDLTTRELIVHDAYTYKGARFVSKWKALAELNGDKDVKLSGYSGHLQKLCERIQPYLVCSESPFMGRFAAAYGALKEQTREFRVGVRNYNPYTPYLFIEPTALKRFMGVRGNSGDKDLMYKALLGRTDISYSGNLDPKDLDEHSVDAVCVCLYHAEKILCSLEPLPPTP